MFVTLGWFPPPISQIIHEYALSLPLILDDLFPAALCGVIRSYLKREEYRLTFGIENNPIPDFEPPVVEYYQDETYPRGLHTVESLQGLNVRWKSCDDTPCQNHNWSHKTLRRVEWCVDEHDDVIEPMVVHPFSTPALKKRYPNSFLYEKPGEDGIAFHIHDDADLTASQMAQIETGIQNNWYWLVFRDNRAEVDRPAHPISNLDGNPVEMGDMDGHLIHWNGEVWTDFGFFVHMEGGT